MILASYFFAACFTRCDGTSACNPAEPSPVESTRPHGNPIIAEGPRPSGRAGEAQYPIRRSHTSEGEEKPRCIGAPLPELLGYGSHMYRWKDQKQGVLPGTYIALISLRVIQTPIARAQRVVSPARMEKISSVVSSKPFKVTGMPATTTVAAPRTSGGQLSHWG